MLKSTRPRNKGNIMAVTGTEIISSIEESKSECLLAIQAARDSLNTTLNEYSNKDDNSIHKAVVSEITDVIQQQFKLIENVLNSKNATVCNTTALERKLKTYIDETETKYKEYLSFLEQDTKTVITELETKQKAFLKEIGKLIVQFTLPDNWYNRKAIIIGAIIGIILLSAGLFTGWKIKEKSMETVEEVIVRVYERQVEKEIEKQIKQYIEQQKTLVDKK